MKLELDLKTDSYNTYCDNEKLGIEFFHDKLRESVWITLGDREVSVSREELKKVVSIM